MFYAIVFTKEFKPGEHWNAKIAKDDPDRKQHWRVGDLYSTGTVLSALPTHLEAIAFESTPPEGHVWDRDSRNFIAP
jgi:hypothetical protein